MGHVAAIRVGDPALRLVHADHVVRESPRGPAPLDLRGIEQLERDVLGGEAVGVVGHRDRGIGGPQIEPAGDGDDPLVGLRLDDRPGCEGPLGEPDVVGPVVGEADDPAVIGGCAVGVPELEPLEPQDTQPKSGRRPICRGRPECPEADDDHVEVVA